MNLKLIALLLALLGVGSALHAQTIEQVERELEAAQAKRAAQQKAAAAEQAQRQRSQAAAAAAAANKGTLVIQVDADCALKIDGSAIQTLRKDEATPVSVMAGEQLIECVSTENPEVRVRQVKAISGGVKSVLVLELAEQLAASSDVLKLNGVTWAKRDNGSDINWSNAKNYCAGLGAGWELPSSAELQGIYDPSGAHAFSWTSPFDNGTYQIKPKSGDFELSSCCFWSKEQNGSGEAWGVDLNDGTRASYDVSLTNLTRALCVRRS